jgi:hypothetical protein
MKVHVRGCGKRLERRLRDALDFYLAELIPGHLIDGLKFVKITVAPRQRVGGWCNMIKKDPTRFNIVINALNHRNTQLEFLAHECVHLKQFFLGELYDLHPDCTPYRDQTTYWRYRRHFLKNWKYEDQPWEHEAYELAPRLTAKYMRSRRLT